MDSKRVAAPGVRSRQRHLNCMLLVFVTTCPKCRSSLPRDGPSRPGNSCPYCGAQLPEGRSWPYWLVLVGAFGLALAAKRLLGPVVDWKILAVVVVVVLTHHLLWIIRRGRRYW